MIYLHGIVENCGAGSKQILVPIVIKIEDSCPPRRETGGHCSDTGGLCDVFKWTFSRIAVQRKAVTVHRSEKDIRHAIIIDISEVSPHTSNSLAVFVVGYTGQECDICECPIAIVVQQEVRNGVVGNKDVGEPIAIIVSKRDPHAFA